MSLFVLWMHVEGKHDDFSCTHHHISRRRCHETARDRKKGARKQTIANDILRSTQYLLHHEVKHIPHWQIMQMLNINDCSITNSQPDNFLLQEVILFNSNNCYLQVYYEPVYAWFGRPLILYG